MSAGGGGASVQDFVSSVALVPAPVGLWNLPATMSASNQRAEMPSHLPEAWAVLWSPGFTFSAPHSLLVHHVMVNCLYQLDWTKDAQIAGMLFLCVYLHL